MFPLGTVLLLIFAITSWPGWVDLGDSDSVAVSFVFLVGTRPLQFIFTNALHNYLGKLAMAILLTPVIYAGHGLFNRYFHLPEKDAPAT